MPSAANEAAPFWMVAVGAPSRFAPPGLVAMLSVTLPSAFPTNTPSASWTSTTKALGIDRNQPAGEFLKARRTPALALVLPALPPLFATPELPETPMTSISAPAPPVGRLFGASLLVPLPPTPVSTPSPGGGSPRHAAQQLAASTA